MQERYSRRRPLVPLHPLQFLLLLPDQRIKISKAYKISRRFLIVPLHPLQLLLLVPDQNIEEV